jgi:hypothetical protein
MTSGYGPYAYWSKRLRRANYPLRATGCAVFSERYTQKLWMALRRKAAYLPG